MRISREKIITAMIANYRTRPVLQSSFENLFLESLPQNVSSYYDRENKSYTTLVEIKNHMWLETIKGDHALAIMFGLSYPLFVALKDRRFEMGYEPRKQKAFFAHLLRTQNHLISDHDLFSRLHTLQKANDYCENYDKKFNYGVDSVTCFGAMPAKDFRLLVPSEENLRKYKGKIGEPIPVEA